MGKPPAHLQFEVSRGVPTGISSFINHRFWESCGTVSQQSSHVWISGVGIQPLSLVSIARWVRQRRQRHRETWRAAAAGEEGSPHHPAVPTPLAPSSGTPRPLGFDLIRGGSIQSLS